MWFACDNSTSPSDTSPKSPSIISPSKGTQLLAGDTITIVWKNYKPSTNATLLYNYNDTNLAFNTANWIAFDSSSILLLNDSSAKVILPINTNSVSKNFQFMIKSTGGQMDSLISSAYELDHIIIISPKGGESYYYGDTVRISWRSTFYMDQVNVSYSHTNNKDGNFLTTKSVDPPIRYFDWIIKKDQLALPTGVNEIKIHVHSYTESRNGSSRIPGLLSDVTNQVIILKDR